MKVPRQPQTALQAAGAGAWISVVEALCTVWAAVLCRAVLSSLYCLQRLRGLCQLASHWNSLKRTDWPWLAGSRPNARCCSASSNLSLWTLCNRLVCLLTTVASQDEYTPALKNDFLPQSSLALMLVVASKSSTHASAEVAGIPVAARNCSSHQMAGRALASFNQPLWLTWEGSATW